MQQHKPLRRHLFTLFLSCLSISGLAQQHLMFSRFLFSPSVFNPGINPQQNKGLLSMGHRSQWLGLEGAPQSQFITYDQPVAGNASVGGIVVHDQAGPVEVTQLFGNYAYRIRTGRQSNLIIGLTAGIANWKADWSKLTLKDGEDPVFLNNIKRWMPNAGSFLSYTYHNWNIAGGVPRFVDYQLSKDNTGFVHYRTLKHFYASVKRDFQVNDWTITPRMQYRNDSWTGTYNDQQYRAPRALDAGVSLGLDNKWLGGVYWRTTTNRSKSSDHALSLSLGYRPKNCIISAAYDIGLNQLQTVSGGSFEIFFGYIIKTKKSAPVPVQDVAPIVIEPSPVPVNPNQLPSPVTPKPVIPSDVEPVADFEIKGIIFDMRSGLPAEGARVTLANFCGASGTDAVITGPDGLYHFTLQANCCYQVTAQKDGLQQGISPKICTNNPNNTSLRADLDLTK